MGWLEGIGEGLEDFWLATDAYIYGYPLVTMEMTRRVMTNVAEARREPARRWASSSSCAQYPDASFRDVTAPNADTLYTTAWLDVGKEPWVLSLPDMKDRYFLFPMLDGWTNVFQVPGKRTTGTGAQTYAITGPGWTGTLPDGVKEYKSPTSMVWILGRIYCTGTPEDYKAVHALQDECKLVPLSAYGKPYTPPAGQGRSVDRHEDAGARSGQRDGRGRILHAARGTDEDQSASRRRRAGARASSPRSASFPARTSTQSKFNADFAKRIPQIAFDRIMLQFKINTAVQEHQRLGLHHQDRPLRHGLPAAGARHRHRPRREPAARRGLSDLAQGCGRQRV